MPIWPVEGIEVSAPPLNQLANVSVREDGCVDLYDTSVLLLAKRYAELRCVLHELGGVLPDLNCQVDQ
jgi:hypothetical protein